MRALELDASRLKVSPAGADPLDWPVARELLARARHDILTGFCSIVRREVLNGGPGRVLTAAPFYLAGESIGLLEASLLLDRWTASGVRPSVPERWRFVRALVEGEMPSLDRSFMVAQLRSGPSRTVAWRRRLRPLRNLRYPNDPRRIPLKRIDLVRDVVITTTGSLLDAHRAASEGRFVFVDYSEWFTPSNAPASVGPAGAQVIAEIVGVVEDAFTGAGSQLTDDMAEYLRAWLEFVMAASSGYLDQIAHTSVRLPRTLWVGTAGSIWARFLFHEVDARGGRVTAHDHGTGSGFRDNPYKTVNDLSGCHTFVTFTERQAIDTRSQLAPELLLTPSAPEVTWVRDPAAGRSIPSERRLPLKRLMVLTNFLRGDLVHHHSVLPDPVAIDIQARVFRHLHEWGYEVLHKPHPESKAASPPGLYSFGAQPIDGYFEDVLDRADAVVLLWDAPSTSLRVALATQLPIVLVDMQQGAWRPHALELLKKRCAVVRAGFDERNRVTLDWDALRSAIEESSELNDDGFFNAYFRG